MAISIYSSLKPSFRPPTSTLPDHPSSLAAAVFPPKSIQVPCSWRRRCFMGVACVIIGSTVGFGMEEISGSSSTIMAEELQGVGMIMRWSERRACPKWHENSLESIVPKNLPRPSARRRFESVSMDTAAPSLVGLSTKNIDSDCFSS